MYIYIDSVYPYGQWKILSLSARARLCHFSFLLFVKQFSPKSRERVLYVFTDLYKVYSVRHLLFSLSLDKYNVSFFVLFVYLVITMWMVHLIFAFEILDRVIHRILYSQPLLDHCCHTHTHTSYTLHAEDEDEVYEEQKLFFFLCLLAAYTVSTQAKLFSEKNKMVFYLNESLWLLFPFEKGQVNNCIFFQRTERFRRMTALSLQSLQRNINNLTCNKNKLKKKLLQHCLYEYCQQK